MTIAMKQITARIHPFRWAVTLAAMILPVTASATEPAARKIEWRHDVQNVLKETSADDKPILLRFFAKWCGPCRVMDARVWPDAQVTQAINDSFTPVEIDIDTPGAADIARQYGVNAVPTIILLNRKGSEVARANFMSPEQLLVFLKDASADGGR